MRDGDVGSKMGLVNYLIDWRHLGIKRGDLVLEVGSGGRPFARSDVLVDMFLDDNTERSLVNLTLDRPLICANTEKLPFESSSFDFVLTSHMLEHLIYPERFLDEIQRVGRRGFLITPSEFCEKIMPSHRHLWLISLDEDNTLVLKQKKQVSDVGLPPILHDVWLTDKEYRKFFKNRPDIFETRLYWEGSIKYRVLREGIDWPDWFHKATFGANFSGNSDEIVGNQPNSISTINGLTRSMLSRILRRIHSGTTWIDIKELIVCPSCHKKFLNAEDSILVCSSCSRQYRLRDDGVPILLLDHSNVAT